MERFINSEILSSLNFSRIINYVSETSLAIEWLVVRIEALQNLTLFTAAFFLVLLPKSQVAPGLVGLSLSYALSLTGTVVFVTR
ncbi:hypothetical protein TIFTF001_045214, partial [Ficus carica]